MPVLYQGTPGRGSDQSAAAAVVWLRLRAGHCAVLKDYSIPAGRCCPWIARTRHSPRAYIGTPNNADVVQIPTPIAIHPATDALLQILGLPVNAWLTKISPRRPSSIATPTEARKQFPHQRGLALRGKWQYQFQQKAAYPHNDRPAPAKAIRHGMVNHFVI